MVESFEFDDEIATPEHSRGAVAPPPTYLEGLNESQREAVAATEGPVLVLAGAGTGKTRALTTRLVHILATGRARPHEILAVTFTNKAAREMKARVDALIGYPAESLWLNTFHSLCVRILRRHAELVGLRSNFTILDTDDQIRLLKQVMAAEDIDTKRWPPRTLLAIIDRWKDRGLAPGDVPEGQRTDFADGRVLALYAIYQERLTTLNATDFGDLILHCLKIFTGHPDVLASYQERFKYLLVDEYQDTNVAQYLWLRLLAQKRRNICCVGDDDQSIYGWRGAEIGNILKFESDFPGARIIRLERNYRSTGHILAAASGLIACNDGRLGKTLWTEGEEGEKVVVHGVWDGEEEARQVGDLVEDLQRKGHPLDDMAILVRASFQTREFEERFITLGLPYRVIGGPRFYERREIRDAMAYLRIINQPDDDLAFERIVNVPRRGIGNATLQAVHHLARIQGMPLLMAAARLIETDELKPQARRALGGLIEDFARWRSLIETMPHPELAETVLDESGYTEMWQRDKAPDAPGRLENLKELIVATADFENLQGFLEHVSLVMENTEAAQGDMINLMTLHSAKGLEFETVFLPGWEEGLFPHQRALDEGGIASLEEERRLAYVGLTRARRRVRIFHAANRRIHNLWQSAIPSRFVDELPADHVESDTQIVGFESNPYGGLSEAVPRTGFGGRSRRSRRDGVVADDGTDILPSTADRDFAIGARVFHRKFGYGTVTSVDGDKLGIDFDHTGEKKVIDSFVQPA
ncbi:MAG: UvrD-helicase domain-containing protein [Alphaproteobacteria bacterium]|nr:UvrD-helicase domain-containing protein [Alphaproteobacteria bacterium]